MIRWTAPLDALFDALSLSAPPRPAEVLFVFAGRAERKPYGLTLWKEGYAPTLLLSVGRFEWRRFAELGLPEDGGLVRLVEQTPPPQRHFFVEVRREGVRAFHVPPGRLGTWSEADALAGYLRETGARSVLVISSAIHLRRAVLTLRALARRGPELRIEASPVPELESSITRKGWWRTPRARRAVLWEGVKLLLYRARLGFTARSG